MHDATKNWESHLQRFGQSHLLKYWTQLSVDDQANLSKQIQDIDFQQLAGLFAGAEQTIDFGAIAATAEPPTAIRLMESNPTIAAKEAYECGEQAIRDGKVGMILVAGGQGTRLGFDLPKGMFRIGPVSNRSLFAMHVDSLRGAMRRYKKSIPLYLMTSPATDSQTREYFAANDSLGLSEDELNIFCQGTMPAIDASTGKILMESPSSLALSPDGHGGIVSALDRQGILKSASQRGIEHFFYAQVDNPLVRACDPLLIGYHLLAKSQMTTQVVKKRFATEKVGNVVTIKGRANIIEYSDLPETAATQTNPDGSLRLWAGNIAVHVLDIRFLIESATESETGEGVLPFHRANKAVPFLNDQGILEKPTSPNAIKFEKFVFDLLPLADRTIVVEADASDVFAPVKNAEGAATDTPTMTRNAISAQHRRWLEQSGLVVGPDVKVEINPNWALDVDEVRMKIHEPSRIMVDTYFA